MTRTLTRIHPRSRRPLRALAPLVLAVLCLTVAVPARAVLVSVSFSIYEDFSTLVGTGGFTFDSMYFSSGPGPISNPYGGYNYANLVPAHELTHAGLDFFGGTLAGTHWDISDVQLWAWYPWPITPDWVGPPQYCWWWDTSADGHRLTGPDGPGSLDAGDGLGYTILWSGAAVPEEKTACVPEPMSLCLLGTGLLGLLLRRHPRRAGTIGLSEVSG